MRARTCILFAIAVAVGLGLVAGHSVCAADNTGSGGVITYTDSSGLNPVTFPPYAGGYVVHTFTNSGTCNIPVAVSADVLVLGGGGGGGQTAGGGGGAGGYLYTNALDIAASSNYIVAVGAGGAGAVGGSWPSYGSGNGGNGSNSVFGALTAVGGGGGGNWGGTGLTGGSGGGHGSGNNTATGAAGTTGQGKVGGKSMNTSGNQTYGGGGGGGAQVVGGNATTGKTAGSGGDGLANAISGSNVFYAGGGGGGAYSTVSNSIAGLGGLGGGGSGGRSSAGTNGVANTGGGGGGGGLSGEPGYSGGSGGSGIVIVRYLYNDGSLAVTLTSPTDGQTFPQGSSISPVATVLNGTAPYTVTFYTNYAGGAYGPAGSTNASPYTVNLGTALAAGTYGIYASVSDNAAATATSRTNTFTVYVLPTSFFWTNAATSVFSAPANWTNKTTGLSLAPVAAGQTNYALTFNQAGICTVTHDLNNGFLLNQLNFDGPTLTLQGNSLAFTNSAAALPQINQNSSNAVAVNTALILGKNVTCGGTGTGLVTISTAMSGGGSLTKDGAGTLKLTALNAHTGGTVVNNGTLDLYPTGIGAGGAVSGNLTINSGATVIANTGWALGYGGGPSVSSITINGGTLSIKDIAVSDGTAASTITLNGGTINLIGSPLDSNFDIFYGYYGYTTTPTIRTLASSNRSTINCGIELRLGSDDGTRVLNFDIAAGSTSDGIDLLVSGAIIKGSQLNAGGAVTKTGAGTLLLAGANAYSGATIISNGTLQVVAGGACSNSAVTVTSAGSLQVGVTNNTRTWTCASLTLTNGAQVKFSFDVEPSVTVAPLNMTSNVTFSGTPVMVVSPANMVGGRTYPLLVAGGTAPGTLPALVGVNGTLVWGGAGNKTLSLTMPASGTLLRVE